MVTPVTYQLQHVRTGKPALAHVNQLRKIPAYKSPADNFTAVGAPFVNLDDDTGSLNWTKSPGNVEPTSGPAPLSSSEDGRPSFEMESILWKRHIGSTTQYLVKFRGYSEPEWVNASDIDGREMITEYEHRHAPPRHHRSIKPATLPPILSAPSETHHRRSSRFQTTVPNL
jgi:hypothetical protein